MENEARQPAGRAETCACFHAPGGHLVVSKELGMDARFAQMTLLACAQCGQLWLRLHDELEAITASGRWYLGAVTAGQAASLKAEDARATLEGLGWYFYGGSYYGGGSGRRSGPLG